MVLTSAAPGPGGPATDTPAKALAGGLFFASGFCSLLYQLVWLRVAFVHFGVITPIISVVVSVFMLGLGLGSYGGGRLASRFPNLGVWPYACAEAIIGVGAFAVPALYSSGDHFLLSEGLTSGAVLWRSSFVVAVSLLPWCLAMGATYPLMMGYLRTRASDARSFSFLYTANLLGAASGILWTAIVSVEWLGLLGSLRCAGAINFSLAILSLALPRRRPSATLSAVERDIIPSEAPAPVLFGTPSRASIFVLFGVGIVSMGLEIVWLRAFSPVLGTTIYAFAYVLFVYLISGWAGTLYYRASARRGRAFLPERLLLWLVLTSLLPLVVTDPQLHCNATSYLASIIPTCFAWGMFTPQLLDLLSEGEPLRAGRGYAVNILGCILGPLLAGYILLPCVSEKWAQLVLLAGLLGMAALLRGARHKRLFLVALTAWAAAFYLQDFETSVAIAAPPSWVRRDATATVVAAGVGMEKMLLVNGVGITRLTPVTKIMAHLPLALMNRKEPNVLLICFGMGSTYRSMLSWGVRTTAVELVPSVKRCFPFFFADAPAVLADPHGQIIIDDGRRFLRNSKRQYDLIAVDPPPPIEAAASSLLYSSDFYRLAKAHLTPGGVLEQWFPFGEYQTFQAIAQSLHESFPFIKVFQSLAGWGFYFLASDRPLQVPTSPEFWGRLPPLAQKDFYEYFSIVDPLQIVKQILGREVKLEAYLPSDPNCRITDDRPYNEYYLLRRLRRRFGKKSQKAT